MQPVECGFRDGATGTGRELLIQLGPTLRVSLGFDEAYDPARPERPPELPIDGLMALIDTGASASCIDATLAMHLDLPVIDQRDVAGIGGSLLVNMHLVQIHASTLSFTLYGAMAGVDLSVGDHKVLLGRDFLRHFVMIYDGLVGSVTLQDPSQPLPPPPDLHGNS